MMRERPILSSGAMVRAIVEGRKTQTRRVVRPQPPDHVRDAGVLHSASDSNGLWWWLDSKDLMDASTVGDEFRCPYGVPGDRLWVREQFSRLESFEFFSDEVPNQIPGAWYWADGNPAWGNWERPKPSIHMPRDLCRIVLEVTDVRVQQLQEISDADAEAEGVEEGLGVLVGVASCAISTFLKSVNLDYQTRLRAAYRQQWEAGRSGNSASRSSETASP